MNFKDYLNSIRLLTADLTARELRLAEVRDRAFGQGSPSLDKVDVMTSISPDPMAEAIIAYSDLLVEYHKVKREYVKRRLTATRIIHKHITDPIVIDMISMRYFDNKTYGDIARKYSLDYRKVQATVRWNVRQICKENNDKNT